MQQKEGVTFSEVDPRQSLPDLERGLVGAWAREGTFEQSLANREGKPRFVFYEGPPTANGAPGVHHVIARAVKDLIGRHRTMKGYYVERKAGWDTHGLPVELEIEKKLGISGKQQIEEFGIAKFNQLCRESVYEYVDDWRVMSDRMAFWQDYDHAYWTLTSDYIQSAWWSLKRLWDQGLIYKGFRVAPYCPRCPTPLSSHELALGYEDNVPDPSIYVRFPVDGRPDTSIPGLDHHPLDAARQRRPGRAPGRRLRDRRGGVTGEREPRADGEAPATERLILAEGRLEVLERPYTVIAREKGSDLVGLHYEPPYRILPPADGGDAWFVAAADFVSTVEGTGIVHTSASYGVDDLALAQRVGMPVRHTVDLRGRFAAQVPKFAGLFVKEADPLITEDLRERGLLYRAETIRHTYPFCWRCSTPLLYYALDAWYIRTTAFKERAGRQQPGHQLAVPAHVRTGRMGDWLENNVDWQFSRTATGAPRSRSGPARAAASSAASRAPPSWGWTRIRTCTVPSSTR